MWQPSHSIGRQELVVLASCGMADAMALQSRLAALCREDIAAVIEEVLDRCAPAQGILRIGRLDIDAGELALPDLAASLPGAIGRALEEALRLDVILVRPPITDVVEVDGEFRGVERPVLAEVFPGRDELIPGSKFCHRSHKPPGYRDFFARATGG